MKTKKLIRNKRRSRRSNSNKRGGLLVMNPEKDLINTHICNVKEGSDKEPTSLEIFTSISDTFELDSSTLGYLIRMFKKTDNRWFKFVIFNNDGIEHIFIITGAEVNKHSVCMLEGLLEVTKSKDEYSELREAYNQLIMFKKNNTYSDILQNPDLKNEFDRLSNNLDMLINRDIKCMPVIAAGSGTVNEDDSICINDKSGHYKPTDETLEISKRIIEEKTRARVVLTKKVDKDILQSKYGPDYKNYTGICL